MVSNLVGSGMRITVRSSLNADDTEILEEVREEELAQIIVNYLKYVEVECYDNGDEAMEEPIPISSQTDALSKVIWMGKGRPDENIKLLSQLRALRQDLEHEFVQGMHQINIKLFFINWRGILIYGIPCYKESALIHHAIPCIKGLL